MRRDDLLKQLSTLPPDTDIGIQIGSDHLDIADLVSWGDGGFVALKCHSVDLRDVLLEWGLPALQREQVVAVQHSDHQSAGRRRPPASRRPDRLS
jgi:hypothetical protein